MPENGIPASNDSYYQKIFYSWWVIKWKYFLESWKIRICRDHKMKLNLPSTLSRFAFWLAISRSVGESIPETRSRFWGNIFILSNCFFSNSVSSVATLWWVTKYALDGDRENVLEQSRNFSKLCSFENSSKECSRYSKLRLLDYPHDRHFFRKTSSTNGMKYSWVPFTVWYTGYAMQSNFLDRLNFLFFKKVWPIYETTGK